MEDKPTEPPSNIHELVIARIYHEDNLFAQRTYVLLAVHAFLMTAFTVLLTGRWKVMLPIPVAISLLGGVMAGMQVLLGRQTNRAIGFWREYCRAIEQKQGIEMDRKLFEFYECARVTTVFGEISGRGGSHTSIAQSFLGHTSVTWMMGIFLPFLLFLFWALALFYVLYNHPDRGPQLSSWLVVIGVATLFFCAVRKRPAHAEWKSTTPSPNFDAT